MGVSETLCKCASPSVCTHRPFGELNRIALRHYDRLIGFLRRRSGCPDDAADIAHDAFMRLSAADIGQIREPGSFLFTTALNLLRDRAKSAHARHTAFAVPVEDADLVCPAPQAERVLEGEQRIRALEIALYELSAKCRSVFVLYHFDEVPQREIAVRLGISVSMVEKYVKQAMAHCQRRLADTSTGHPQGGGAAP